MSVPRQATLHNTFLHEDEIHESPLLKTVCRYSAASEQMSRKTETASTVLSQYSGLSTSYKYDAKGHLVEASMRTCYEDYTYNGIGQRISMLHTRKGVFHYTYDAQGKLAQVNDTRFQYDPLGRLSGITAPNIPTRRFAYERVRIGDLDIDRLSTFQDSTGKSYSYSYMPKNPLPIAVHCYGQPVVTYQWEESGALPRLLLCTTPFATWQFGYQPENDGRLPDTVILTGPAVAKLGYWDLKSLQCKLGYDHLGTVKLIADPFNELVKELFYDSFGNNMSETEQRIYFPLGFAGGLRDIATGFVCFGFRDYDPSVGRFTTPDPALDVRGDGDIYDYCVDDPVNRMDAKGLAFTGSGNHEPVRLEPHKIDLRKLFDLDSPRPELHRTVKMAPFETDERVGYWRTIPEEGACKKCLEMAKQRLKSRPERPHPNCKCEIEFVKLPVTPDKGTIDKIRENHSNSKRYEYDDKGIRFYVIGQRPLDSGVGRWLYTQFEAQKGFTETVFNLAFLHEGFISPTTGKTLGFSDGADGYYIGPDKERLLSSYRLGSTGYNADIIDEAAKIVEHKYIDENSKIIALLRQVIDEEAEFKIYNLISQNCQDFVDAVLREARIIAQNRGVDLIVFGK